MKYIRRASIVLLTSIISFVFVPVVFAHPLGNFTINHYAGLLVSPTAISIDYVLDMAEIAAFQEIGIFDENGNGQAEPAEAGGYHAQKCASLQQDLKLMINNRPLALTTSASSVEFPAGAGGLPTLRLTCGYQAVITTGGQLTSLSFVDDSYSERIGWREIVVIADGARLNGDFSSTSISNRLTSYPEDLISNPPDQREITLDIGVAAAALQTNAVNSAQSVPSISENGSDAFTQLITLENLTLRTVLFAILISFVWGAMHAMTPGHGKTIVGAYLVGSRGTVKHALYLGLTTTITHTLGVFAFGLITLFAANYIVPEKLFPWITLLSGLFVVGIGINLFLERFKSSGLGVWFGRSKMHRLGLQPAYSTSLNEMRIQASEHRHQHRFVIASSHRHEHTHDHAGHSHMPPETVTWRNLLALGVSGGLLPCPSALVVLLGAIALNKIGFGLVLVLAFSFGLAGALTGIGILFIYAGKLFQRFPASGKVIGFLPALSALFVSVIGIGIIAKALAEMGMI